MIKIAIQKSGRLNEESLSILKKCGISIDNGKDQLKASAEEFPYGSTLSEKWRYSPVPQRWGGRLGDHR